ncbi:uncharacterized protein LOC106169812 [Lingula anatina]|uniref:Uncharacterized protein LOC106169812 n=1 Tax=Lingula anatina TaxID=7574 RepID=A0A1S3J3A1_LINAN|nr:uncharacterized protein LOC106169812 [Lingula anatina]|eukprot:XP_013404885.1 uncharacterized protein LOC106169812 [Lingula anatina]
MLLAQQLDCGSLTPGNCKKLDELDAKRAQITAKVNATLEREVYWSVLNYTNDEAIDYISKISKELEVIASSNIRLMEILRTISVVEENETVYVPDNNDEVVEQQIRFRANLTEFINGMRATTEELESEIADYYKKDFAMLAMMTLIPILAMHTGLITTTARTWALSQSQNYQVVELVGARGSYQLAYDKNGKMFIVQQEPGNLGKLKVYAKLSETGKVGSFWKFMMPAGQSAATKSFLESVDYNRAKQVASLMRLEPDYLQKLKSSGHLPAFLRSTDGLTTQQFDEFVETAKTKDPKVMFSAEFADTTMPKWMSQTLSIFDPSDIAAVDAYNKLKAASPDLLADLEKKGKLGAFISQSKGLVGDDFNEYMNKVKQANLEVDGLKNFDFDAPAKSVKSFSWEKIKSGWASIANKQLFDFQGRKIKVSTFVNMANIGSLLNVGLCIYIAAESSITVDEQVEEIERRVNKASDEIDEKMAELEVLITDEENYFDTVKNNFYDIVSMFDVSEDSTGIAADPDCQDSLCIFLRDAAELNPIKNYIAAWPNASITNETILHAQAYFLSNLTESKYQMVQLYRVAEMVAQVMIWVQSDESIDQMMANAVTLSKPFDSKYDLLRLIALAFPDRDEYTGYPLKCIRSGSITSEAELDTWMTSNQVKTIDPDVTDYISSGVDFDQSVSAIVGKLVTKYPTGCGGGECTTEDVLKEIAVNVLPNADSYDGVDLAPYRVVTITCPAETTTTTTTTTPPSPTISEELLQRIRDMFKNIRLPTFPSFSWGRK